MDYESYTVSYMMKNPVDKEERSHFPPVKRPTIPVNTINTTPSSLRTILPSEPIQVDCEDSVFEKTDSALDLDSGLKNTQIGPDRPTSALFTRSISPVESYISKEHLQGISTYAAYAGESLGNAINGQVPTLPTEIRSLIDVNKSTATLCTLLKIMGKNDKTSAELDAFPELVRNYIEQDRVGHSFLLASYLFASHITR
jgi:hypothetical protein